MYLIDSYTNLTVDGRRRPQISGHFAHNALDFFFFFSFKKRRTENAFTYKIIAADELCG